MEIILSSSPAALRATIAGLASVTVEAEYGDDTVRGSIATLAHHGLNKGNKCPCAYNNIDFKINPEVIGISHVDLDTLGGVAAVMGIKPWAPSFWELAEFVDLNGPHKLSSSGASELDISRIHAFWAWSDKNRVYAPRDGAAVDVTDKVKEAISVIKRIVYGDPELIAAGEAYRLAGERLDDESFVEERSGVLFRVHESFVNHLYARKGVPYQAVVAFSTKFGSVTVSFADGAQSPISAREFVQELWGQLAGGHHGIAGSPREAKMTIEDARSAFEALARKMGG